MATQRRAARQGLTFGDAVQSDRELASFRMGSVSPADASNAQDLSLRHTVLELAPEHALEWNRHPIVPLPDHAMGLVVVADAGHGRVAWSIAERMGDDLVSYRRRFESSRVQSNVRAFIDGALTEASVSLAARRVCFLIRWDPALHRPHGDTLVGGGVGAVRIPYPSPTLLAYLEKPGGDWYAFGSVDRTDASQRQSLLSERRVVDLDPRHAVPYLHMSTHGIPDHALGIAVVQRASRTRLRWWVAAKQSAHHVRYSRDTGASFDVGTVAGFLTKRGAFRPGIKLFYVHWDPQRSGDRRIRSASGATPAALVGAHTEVVYDEQSVTSP